MCPCDTHYDYCTSITVIQVGIAEVLYEVSEGPGKELTVCVSIELGTVNSETTTVVLLTPPSADNTGK